MASQTTRVFRATNTSPAAIKLTEDSVAMVGGGGNAVVVNSKGMGFIGAQSWMSTGSQRRLAGLWVHQTEMLDMIPETIVTPFPNIMIMPPLAALTNLAEDMAFFAALLG